MPEPIWRHFAGLDVEYSALYVALSLWIALLLFSRRALARGEDPERCSDWVLFSLVGGLLGARIGYFVFEIPLQFIQEPWGLIWNPGFSLQGAALGVALATTLFARSTGVGPQQVFDDLALSGAVAFLLSSLGSLLSNDVAGVAVESVLSLRFPLYDASTLDPPLRLAVIHLQVLWAVCLVALVWFLARSNWAATHRPGALSSITWCLIFAGLLLLDPFKVESRHVAAESIALKWSVVDFLCLSLGLGKFIRNKEYQPVPNRSVDGTSSLS